MTTNNAAALANHPAARGATDFFSQRPILQHIRTSAQALMVAPWAVLGIVLTEALAATGPGYQGPALIGGNLIPNFGLIIVGRSGQGKGASEKAGRSCVHFASTTDGDMGRITTEQFPMGSGEGVVTTYRPAGIEDEEPNERDRAIFTVPEIDTLTALSSRAGSTIDSVLRSLLVGETLGFTNAGKDRRTRVQDGSYRAAVVIGAQPAKSDAILNAADGGLPQRFVWLPATDPNAPDICPALPEPVRIVLPMETRGRYVFKVPSSVRQTIQNHRRNVLRGSQDVDPLDGHRMATQLKVAAALALLDGRADVSEDDWRLAYMVMIQSSNVRDDIRLELAQRRRESNRARAIERADTNTIMEQHELDQKMNRARNGILSRLNREPVGVPVARAELGRALRSDIREFRDDALNELLESGTIQGDGTRYWTA